MLSTVLLLAQVTVAIPAGSYRPLYERPEDGPVRIAAFRLDREPVTRGEFLAFVRDHVAWRRGAVRPLLAMRETYLASWRGDLGAGDATDLRRPATEVSWFAARAYCASKGKRLPTIHEWEYAAAAGPTQREASRDPAFIQSLVARYATRSDPLPPVGAEEANAYGVRALHAQWEWVADFDRVLVSDGSRGIGGRQHDLFCAGAAIRATDPTNYPAFLRYALRAGLTARSSLRTLGFRCAA